MSRVVVALLVVALVAGAATAWAGPVYKCKDADGNIVFTDKKCDAEAKQERIWDSHLGDSTYPPMFSGATPAGMQAAQAAQGSAYGGDLAPVRSSGDDVRGYLCDTGRRRWVQDRPCPAMAREPHSTVIQRGDGSWSRVTSDGPSHVHQTPISRDQLCNNLKAVGDTYERNRIARENGCR